VRGLRALQLLAILLPAVAQGQELPQPVKIGFYVNSVANIDFADGSFGVRAHAWFIHPEGSFDPTTGMEVAAREASVETITRSRLPDGSVYDWVKIEATVDQDFDFSRFPFDRQSLRLVLEAEEPIDRLRFVPDVKDTRIGELVAITGWDVLGWRLEEEPIEYDTDFGWPEREPRTYSRLIFTIDVARQRSGLVIEKFLGFAMAFLISLLVYVVRPRDFSVRVGLTLAAVFALIGNRSSLDALLGSDSEVGLVDQITLIVFASIYTALVISLLVYHLNETRGPIAATRLDRVLGAATSMLYLGLAVAAFVHAQR
jgi:hypothetical protein